MSEERTIYRQMLYEDLRGESNLRLLPANDSQRRLFLQLGKYLQEDTQRPIIVSSPVGFGSSFVRGFIDALRPPRTDVELFGLAEMRNPLESIGALMNSLRRYATHDRRILIVLDDADKLSSLQLEKVIGHVFNWKRIKHLIIITNNSSLEVRR